MACDDALRFDWHCFESNRFSCVGIMGMTTDCKYHIPSRRLASFLVVLSTFTLLAAGGAISDDKDSGDKRDADHAGFLKTAESLELRREDADKPLELRTEPILKWTNPERGQQQRGAVFVWLEDGRPLAVGSAFIYVSRGLERHKRQLHSLSTDALKGSKNGDVFWKPKQGVEWKTFKDAPQPASKPRLRLVQMRRLARDFDVRLHDRQAGPRELRLIPQPLFRYESDAAGVVDGAIFSFAVATDPEALLLVESYKTDDGSSWRYAFARFHYWELDARLDGQAVWSATENLNLINTFRGDPSLLDLPYISFKPPDTEVAE